MAEKTHIVFINDKLGKRRLVLPGGRRRTIRHLEELESNDPIIELYPSLVIKREKVTDNATRQEKELLVEEPVGEAEVDESEDEVVEEPAEEESDAEPKMSPEEIAESFTKKDELDVWAEEHFNIKLDKRSTLKKMKEEFVEKLNS